MVSIKTPSDVPPLQVSAQSPAPHQRSDSRSVKSMSPAPRKSWSPSAARATTSPDWSSGKKKHALDESALGNADMGPFLLKLARNTISSGEGPIKALDYAVRALKSFELCSVDGELNLDLVMTLHVLAAVYCSLGRFDDAVSVLDRSVSLPEIERGADHGLALFSGYMQLGDTYSLVGRLDKCIDCYKKGLEIQVEILGDDDPRVAETCRYLAESHLEALQFDEAEVLCKRTLDIHQIHSDPASLDEAADRRLMALVCEGKGDYESALEHLVLASVSMMSNGKDIEVAAIDVSIGNVYSSLCRYDEAVFSYQKALTVFKSSKGDNHPSVASVFVRLSDLYHKTGKLRESKSYCENALRIYNKPPPGTTQEEIANGFSEISAIYEFANEHNEALKLLRKAAKILDDKPGQQCAVAGIEVRVGMMLYAIGKYGEARECFEKTVANLRVSRDRKSVFLGIVLNQMALACVQLFKIDEAAEMFEEARVVLEEELGPCHPDTLGVYSNLAATYDAMGRVEEAIGALEHVVKLREEKLGTANPEFEGEKRRLEELLKDAGRSRNRKAKSLENLIDRNNLNKKEGTRRWGGFTFRT